VTDDDQMSHQENGAAPAATAMPEPVRAEHVEISQGGASSIEATTVSVTQGGAGRVRAGELTISQGGIGLAQADNLRLNEGASAFALAGNDVSIQSGANVFMLLARSASGDVRPVLDWRAAAAFGAGLGLALRLLRRRR
jgi:large exoprotein involved in heme utilization and adhesion